MPYSVISLPAGEVTAAPRAGPRWLGPQSPGQGGGQQPGSESSGEAGERSLPGQPGEPSAKTPDELIEMLLVRLVHFEGGDRQHIFLRERAAPGRSFPIVIGNFEAGEIQRILAGQEPERPLTHRLLHETIEAVGARLGSVDIVDLSNGTFFARLSLDSAGPKGQVSVDARPSDAIALALRARCPIRVARHVLEQAAAGGA